jgi:hypothetical protein
MVGCHIRHHFCGALGYADDLTLMSPTITSMKILLKTCQDFANEYNMKFNAKKSKYLFYGPNANRSRDSPFSLNSAQIELVDDDKHLGNVIGNKSSELQVRNIVNVLNSKLNMIVAHFKFLNSACKYKLFNCYCMPLYGVQLLDLAVNIQSTCLCSGGKYSATIFLLKANYSRIVKFIKCLCNSTNQLVNLCYK